MRTLKEFLPSQWKDRERGETPEAQGPSACSENAGNIPRDAEGGARELKCAQELLLGPWSVQLPTRECRLMRVCKLLRTKPVKYVLAGQKKSVRSSL